MVLYSVIKQHIHWLTRGGFAISPNRSISAPNVMDLLLTPEPSNAVYSRLFAEAGMFTPGDTDSNGQVNRTYHMSDGTVINHTGPELGLGDEDCLIGMIQLTNKAFADSKEEVLQLAEFQSMRRASIESRRKLLGRDNVSSEGANGPDEDESAFAYLDAELTLRGEISDYLINKYLNVAWSSKAKKLRAQSVERLENTVIQITTPSEKLPRTHLLRTLRDRRNASKYTVIFDLHLHMLIGQLVNIDLTLRNKLNSVGKCLHRLLTLEGFPDRTSPFEIDARDFRTYIGLPKESFSRLRKSLEGTRTGKQAGPLDVMIESGFIRNARLEGRRDRSNPFSIVVE